MSHFYERKYNSIYSTQPKTFTELEKLVSIDRLACTEVSLNQSSDQECNLLWYFHLATILTQQYLKNCPYLRSEPLFKKITEVNLRCIALNVKTLEDKKVLSYIKDRRQLTDLIVSKENLYERQNVKE